MTWDYYEADDYYIDSKGVRLNFNAYRKGLISMDLYVIFKSTSPKN